jgi:folate-binding Fe-S cluster repair protein YgfZ
MTEFEHKHRLKVDKLYFDQNKNKSNNTARDLNEYILRKLKTQAKQKPQL